MNHVLRSVLPRRRDAWMTRIEADPDSGGMKIEPRFFAQGDDFRGLRVHQTRLQGGDASSESCCDVD